MKTEHKIDKAFLIKLTQSFVIGLIIFIVAFFLRWKTTPDYISHKKIFFTICDAAFITGVILLTINFLIFTKNSGMANIISFSMNVISNRIKNTKSSSYYEYTKQKENESEQKEKNKSEKKIHWLRFAISGFFFILVSIILMFFC